MRYAIFNISSVRFAFLRTNRTVKNNRELMANIEKHGILQPITVIPAELLPQEQLCTTIIDDLLETLRGKKGTTTSLSWTVNID